MVRQILPNNNEKCYGNFSPKIFTTKRGLKSHGSCCVPVCVHEEPQDKARALATSFCKAAMTSTSIRSHRSRSHTPCCHSHASRSSRHDMVTCTHACIRPPTAWAGVDAEKRKENVWAPCCTLWVAMLGEFFLAPWIVRSPMLNCALRRESESERECMCHCLLLQ
jgi:hypothetical protein